MDLLSILDGTPEPSIVDLHLEKVNNSGEYNLPTPMFEFQKELTDQIVSLHYPDILKYCETNDTTELIVKSLEICVDNCMLVASHPYLLIQHYMPKNLGIRDIPAKLAETSGKFNVLKDLMNVIISNSVCNLPKHVGIVMKNDLRVFDLVEALVLGCTGPKTIQRYMGNNVKKESGKGGRGSKELEQTTIHMIPHDGKVTRNENELKNVKFNLLIAFDGYVDTSSQFFKGLRTQNRRGEETVLIRLIPINTIEHCLLHYKDDKDSDSYLYKLISCIVCLRDQVGILQPDLSPIYNQKLTYLSHTFFDHVFRRDLRSFPPWPLPELTKIPRFSPTDVERSLLTEVVYHYTPYDSNEPADNSLPQKKKTYYETKRLQLDYVDNPLKNDYQTLSGIHNHHEMWAKGVKDRTILSHKLILELNTGYLSLSKVEEEYNTYLAFNTPEHQEKFGRRIDEIKSTLSKIIDDVDHAEQRIQVAEKKILKRNQEVKVLEESMQVLKDKLTGFLGSHEIPKNSNKEKFVTNQLKIWELQNEAKTLLAKIQSKREERNYMTKEVSNSLESTETSNTQANEIQEKITELKRSVASAEEEELAAKEQFKKQKISMNTSYEKLQKENELLRAKMTKYFKFLRDTSNLKKRKGRGLTPNLR